MPNQNSQTAGKIRSRSRQDYEEALRFAEDCYRRLFDTARDGLLIINHDSAKIDDANPSLMEMLGYSVDELRGKRLWEISAFKDAGLNENVFERLLQKGSIRYKELSLQTKRGTKIQTDLTGNVYDCAEKKHILFNLRDITERKLAETEYTAIISATMDGFFVTDVHGQFRDVNDACCRILGYSRSELLDLNLHDVNMTNSQEETAERLRKIKKIGHERFDTVLRRKDGTVLHIEISINFMPEGGGKLIAFIRDITERKRTELALRQQQAFSDAVIGSAPGVFFVTDEQGNLVRSNASFDSMAKRPGNEREEMAALHIIHEDDREKIAAKLAEAFATGSAHADARVHCHERGIRNYSLSARRFELDGTAYLTGFGIDNTELVHIQNDLLKEKAFLEATLESAPGAFFVLDKKQNFARWNSFMKNLTGQMQGSSILSYIIEQDHPIANAKILAAFATGYAQKIELRIQTRKQGIRTYFTTLRRFEIGGEFYLACFGMDVTERKLTEDALTNEKEFSNALIDSMPGVFFVVDSEGNYLRWNSYLNRLTGLSDSELMHMPSLLTIQEEDRAIAAAALKESFETGSAKAELHIITHERGRRIFLMTVRRFKVKDALYLVGVGIDTTDKQADAHELKIKACTDPLTGISNRGHFLVQAEQEIDRSRRYGHPLSIWMLDIDHFKNVNDTHGHHAGDLALQALVDVSKKVLREMDIMGRIGGEEFAVLLPETDTEQALLVAERLRQKIAATEIFTDQNKSLRYTVSIGVATLEDTELDINALLHRADQALYRAKKTGRDKVCIAQSNMLPNEAASAHINPTTVKGRPGLLQAKLDG